MEIRKIVWQLFRVEPKGMAKLLIVLEVIFALAIALAAVFIVSLF